MSKPHQNIRLNWYNHMLYIYFYKNMKICLPLFPQRCMEYWKHTLSLCIHQQPFAIPVDNFVYRTYMGVTQNRVCVCVCFFRGKIEWCVKAIKQETVDPLFGERYPKLSLDMQMIRTSIIIWEGYPKSGPRFWETLNMRQHALALHEKR